MKGSKYFIFIIFLTVPQVAYGAGLMDLLDAAMGIVNDVLLPFAYLLCTLYFFWGVAKYIGSGAAGEKAAEEGRKIMLHGILALFVAFSIWGIITFIRTELTIPSIPIIQKPRV